VLVPIARDLNDAYVEMGTPHLHGDDLGFVPLVDDHQHRARPGFGPIDYRKLRHDEPSLTLAREAPTTADSAQV